MRVETLQVGQLATSCYLVESAGKLGIVDPGDDGEYIIRRVGDLGGEVKWIVATHGHFDHVLAVTELVLAFKVPFYMHGADEFLLKRGKETAEYFTGVAADLMPINYSPLSEGMRLQLGEVEFEVIETPGHTPGSLSFYCEREKVLFCGDLVFSEGAVGRTDFSYGSEEELGLSIRKVLRLADETVVYPGHGEATMVEALRKVL